MRYRLNSSRALGDFWASGSGLGKSVRLAWRCMYSSHFLRIIAFWTSVCPGEVSASMKSVRFPEVRVQEAGETCD